MKSLSYFVSALALTLSLSCADLAKAQTAPDSNLPGGGQALSSLGRQDKMKLLRARREVFNQNPALKAEQDKLERQRQDLQSQGAKAAPGDRKAFIEKFVAHEKKIRPAMLQIDPTLAPVFQQIDQTVRAKMQSRTNQGSE